MMLSTMHARGSDDAGILLDSVKNDAEKFFWITSLNRVVDHPIAIGIARIGRKAIRMRIASCDERSARNRRLTSLARDDSMVDRAVSTTRDLAPRR
jgi:hypothetical protein